MLYDRYRKPIFILENGLGAKDIINDDGMIHDYYRFEYLNELIKAIQDAENDGVEIMGLTIWAPIDMVSFSTGKMSKRCGMIYVDKMDDGSVTFKRIKKDSFYWYKKVISENGIIERKDNE